MLNLKKFRTSTAVHLMAGMLFLTTGFSAKADFTVSSLINTQSALLSGGLAPAPVLNDNGIFAFGANTSYYEGSFGLVYGSIASPGTVSALNNVTFAEEHTATIGPFSLAIDNGGSVLWMNDNQFNRSLALVSITDPGQPRQMTSPVSSMSGRSLGMNNSGMMGYRDGSNTAIYVYYENTLRTIASGQPGSFYFSGGISINDSGKIAYAKTGAAAGLFVYDWQTEATQELTPSNIVIPAGDTNSNPVINNAGLVAFFALDATTEEVGLYTMSLANPTGQANFVSTFLESSFLDDMPISLNDQGQILFVDSNGALKFWNGTAVETILEIGDTFGGGIISGLFISTYALNNNGDGVFRYQLQGGVEGIGLMSIPEPSSILLLGATAVAIGIRTARKRRKG